MLQQRTFEIGTFLYNLPGQIGFTVLEYQKSQTQSNISLDVIF
jgi:hypothetical protein